MAERPFSEEERRRLAAEGETGYGDSYPMPDCDAVQRAVDSYGRAPEEHRAELRRKIAQRKMELGCDDVHLPSNWRLSRAR
jgi:hypothetical protein